MTAYRVLGPLEATTAAGRAARLGGLRQRAVLAVLLLHANEVVPVSRLIDEVWPDEPPDTAANVVQGYVSRLRKELGRGAIETREPGYVLRAERPALDLERFERLATDGAVALDEGRPDEAARLLREALALWRGPALADVADAGVARAAAARLDELRLVGVERRLEADLARGEDAELVPEIESLVEEHPWRERLRGLLMLALYRSDRQAEALQAYRTARKELVDELGIEPGPWLRDLEASMLRQDQALRAAPVRREATDATSRSIVAAVLDLAALDQLLALAEPLAREPPRELIVLHPVASAAALEGSTAQLQDRREVLLRDGVAARTAAFTSLAPGADLARLAVEHDVDLVLADAPARLLEDQRLLTLLEQAPCDVAVVVGDTITEGPVLVPFTGVDHDWAAVELGAWLARNRSVPLRLAGSTTGASGRDSSRLLANASIAVQRALGTPAEPVLVEPSPEALVAAADDASVVVVGLTERWRREGLGRTRTALAARSAGPTVLIRRGMRPGGLAPAGSQTRFTWSIAR